MKSSRLQVHGCFLDGSATCNKKNEQYVPAGRGLGRHSLFPHAVPLLSGNEAAVWSDSAIPPLQLLQFFWYVILHLCQIKLPFQSCYFLFQPFFFRLRLVIFLVSSTPIFQPIFSILLVLLHPCVNLLITHNGKLVASGSFDVETGEMGRNIYIYTPIRFSFFFKASASSAFVRTNANFALQNACWEIPNPF